MDLKYATPRGRNRGTWVSGSNHHPDGGAGHRVRNSPWRWTRQGPVRRVRSTNAGSQGPAKILAIYDGADVVPFPQGSMPRGASAAPRFASAFAANDFPDSLLSAKT